MEDIKRGKKVEREFFQKPADEVAPLLLGAILARKTESGEIIKRTITETECYMGEEDSACHASKGKTERTKIMYMQGGTAYIYLVYGMHDLLNIVTGEVGSPQAVLIRATDTAKGPAKLTKELKIDRKLNGIDTITSDELWIEYGEQLPYRTTPRIGIDYAKEPYKSILWRFEAINID